MTKYFRFCTLLLVCLLGAAAHSQSVFSFSGSDQANNSTYNFYSPLISGNKSVANSIINSGPVHISDTTVVLDTSITQYDLDSIPAQVVFSNVPCKFYIKSNSKRLARVKIRNRIYAVEAGKPRGNFLFDRLNLVQYTSSTDTLDFDVVFAIVTTTNDTIKSTKPVHYKVVPAIPAESAIMGVSNNLVLPNPEDRDWQILTTAYSEKPVNGFNYIPNQTLRRISFSGVKVVLEKNGTANPLSLLTDATNIDTLNIYAETLVVRDGFRFPGTTINIFARNLVFEDVKGRRSYISTTPKQDENSTNTTASPGLKAGDIYLHVQQLTSVNARRFILTGGEGQYISKNNFGSGGDGGNVYSDIDVEDFVSQQGGYSGSTAYKPGIKTKGLAGNYHNANNSILWLSPAWFSMAVDYYKEGFYNGSSLAVTQNLKEYQGIIESAIDDGSLYSNDSATAVHVQQLNDEITRALYLVNNRLDYFGNPEGWVPMLSFEVALTAYQNEVKHSVNAMFLDRMIQSSNSSLTQKANGYKQLREEAKTSVEENMDQYNDLSNNVIPGIKDRISDNNAKTDELKRDLKQIDKELSQKAQAEYDERQSYKWIGIGSSILSMIPSPLAQVTSQATNLIVGAIGGNVAKGYESGQKIAEHLTPLIEPFTSGTLLGQVSTFKNNLQQGYTSIRGKEINTAGDADEVAETTLNLYEENAEIAGEIYNSATAAVEAYNSLTQVNEDELGSIKGEMIANDPRLAVIAEQMASLQESQLELSQNLEQSTLQLVESKNNIYNGLSAISSFSNTIFDASAAVDHGLAIFSGDMKRNSLDRLRKYHYLLVKAYEYRTLKPYPANLLRYNPTKLVARLDTLIKRGNDALTDKEFEVDFSTTDKSLVTIYQEEIQQIANAMYNYYSANRPSNTIKTTFSLSKDELKLLNENKPVKLNFIESGLFSPSRENLRIVNLKVSKVNHSVEEFTDNGTQNTVIFRFAYPNYSRIKNNGQVFIFNNYNAQTESPFTWSSELDVLTSQMSHAVPSENAASLLYTLLDGKTQNFVLYSQPSAWADIFLTKEQLTSGNALVHLDNVFVELEYDYIDRTNTSNVNIEINTVNKWFAPTFKVDKADRFGNKDGIGDIHRSFAKSTSSYVNVEAPAVYGRYVFDKWVNGSGSDITDATIIRNKNTIRFSLGAHRSFKAKYKFTGATIVLPDTVYLNESRQYTLNIKHTGGGTLNWSLDSLAPWIRYSGPASGVNDTTITLTFDQNPDTLSRRFGILDVSSTKTEGLHNYIYFVQGRRRQPKRYEFVGNGNWNKSANWSNGERPPANLSAKNEEIEINPRTNGECVLNVEQTISNNTKLTVLKGKQLRITGKLNVKPNATVRIN